MSSLTVTLERSAFEKVTAQQREIGVWHPLQSSSALAIFTQYFPLSSDPEERSYQEHHFQLLTHVQLPIEMEQQLESQKAISEKSKMLSDIANMALGAFKSTVQGDIEGSLALEARAPNDPFTQLDLLCHFINEQSKSKCSLTIQPVAPRNTADPSQNNAGHGASKKIV